MSISILLADDHAIMRDGLRALLGASGDHEIVGIAGDGRQAVDEALRLMPDIVVMDIAMPELDGIEATRRVVERCPGTQVVILSMYLTAEHVYRALNAGARGYVLKESAGDELVEAIRTVRNGSRFLSQGIAETVLDEQIGRNGKRSPIESLSIREREVLHQVINGRTNAAIAKSLDLSPKTVETYRARILKKLQVPDTVELVKFAMRHGLTA